MTFIYIPPYPGRVPWPPAGRPVGGCDTHAQAQSAIAFLVARQIPPGDLAIVGVTAWRSGLVAALAGAVVGVPVGLIEGAHGWTKVAVVVVWTVAAVSVLLGMIVAVTGFLHNRRFRRFLRSPAGAAVQGRHVILCSAGRADRARDLLAARGANRSTVD